MSTLELASPSRLTALLLLASVGCGDVARPPVLLVAPPPPVPATRMRDSSLVAAHAGSGTPSGFVMDGDVAEWTLLFHAPPRSNEPEELDPKAPRPVRNPASHLAVARAIGAPR